MDTQTQTQTQSLIIRLDKSIRQDGYRARDIIKETITELDRLEQLCEAQNTALRIASVSLKQERDKSYEKGYQDGGNNAGLNYQETLKELDRYKQLYEESRETIKYLTERVKKMQGELEQINRHTRTALGIMPS